jgi:Mg-chelatase subunit ChlD
VLVLDMSGSMSERDLAVYAVRARGLLEETRRELIALVPLFG